MNRAYYQIARRVNWVERLLLEVMANADCNDAARAVADERAKDIATMVELPIKCLDAVLRQQQQAAGL